MYVLLVIVYVLVALFLIMVVLLQSGKGASMGAAFGGSAQTMFGTRGKASGIEKTTVVAAILFMVLSIALASLSAQTRSSLDTEPAPPGGEAGLAPVPEPAPPPAAADAGTAEAQPAEKPPEPPIKAVTGVETGTPKELPPGPPPGAVPVEPQPTEDK